MTQSYIGLVMLSNFTKYHRNGTNIDYYKYDFTAPFSSQFGLGDGQQMTGLKGSDYLFESLKSPSDEEYPITTVLDLNVKDPTSDSIKILETIFYLDPFQLIHSYTLQPIQIGGNFTSDIQSNGDGK